MDDEWDLHAVVRSCTAASAAAATTVNVTTVEDYDDGSYNLESLASGNEDNLFSFPTMCNVSGGGLEDVYRAGCGKTTLSPTAAIAIDVDGEGFFNNQLPTLTDSHSFSMHAMISTSDQSIRPRKRKNQEKMVFQLTQEQLSNDLWAWRKYGQKPIKGSPFPRNYYRCSTTKACGAKRQVERSLFDSTIFIISYSGQHIHPPPTHRSSLAGSTRSNKFKSTDLTKPPPLNSGNTAPCSSSSPASNSSFSPTTSFQEDQYEIDGEEYDEGARFPNVVMMNDDDIRKFRNMNGGGDIQM